jgi:hypothetical protein
MNWTGAIAALGAFMSAVIALFVWINARKTITNQVFHSVIAEYKSPDFMLALQRLYGLRDTCRGDAALISSTYESIKVSDAEEIMRQPFQARLEFERNTLHFQRRLVSNFYYYLCTAVLERMIPRDVAYKFWDLRTLQVIPTILVPIKNDDISYLMQLYDDAVRFSSQKSTKKPLLAAAIGIMLIVFVISLLVALGIL